MEEKNKERWRRESRSGRGDRQTDREKDEKKERKKEKKEKKRERERKMRERKKERKREREKEYCIEGTEMRQLGVKVRRLLFFNRC